MPVPGENKSELEVVIRTAVRKVKDRGFSSVDKIFYAHSKEAEPPEKWQRLEGHLKNVEEMARGFAEDFGAGEWGYLAGLWHDLGKYHGGFQ